jgi:hypothetical protein
MEDHVLTANSLMGTQSQYKAFMARRKLRSSVKAVMVISRMRRLSGLKGTTQNSVQQLSQNGDKTGTGPPSTNPDNVMDKYVDEK